jgi:hypothetical protein
VKMHATQHHLLWRQHITHAQFWHEQAMLLKQVPSASDNFFKNYWQNKWAFYMNHPIQGVTI